MTTTGGGLDNEPVVVWEAANLMEAQVVKGRLESEGIPALIVRGARHHLRADRRQSGGCQSVGAGAAGQGRWRCCLMKLKRTNSRNRLIRVMM